MTRTDISEHRRHYQTLHNFGHGAEGDRGLALLAEIERLTAASVLIEALGEIRHMQATNVALLTRVNSLEAADKTDLVDAARWRSLMACERIRFIGGSYESSAGEPDALVGFDFHRKHPERDDERSRKILFDFVDLKK